MNPKAQQVIDACEADWDANKSDCNAFVRAVAGTIGINIPAGDANFIVDWLTTQGWDTPSDGTAAEQQAETGQFVIGGLKGADHIPPRVHGHVVVVVVGPLAQNKYPSAYWGSLGNVAQKNLTVNMAWVVADLDNVTYFAHSF